MAPPMVLHTFVRWALIVLVCFVYFASVLPSLAMTSTLFVGGARIEVVTDPSRPSLPLEDVLVWVKTAAESVRIYYGVFPISPISIHITPFRGRGIRNGMAFGTEKGGRITIRVGTETSSAEFASDWTLAHEMVHLAFPSVAEEHHWIEEGIATYVEPIARVRAGQLAPERMWADLVRDMPQGLPQKGDRGLDRTHTLGGDQLGRGDFLPLGRPRNTAADQEHKRFGACSSRHSSGRRQYSKQLGSRGGLAGGRSRHRHARP